MVVLLSSSSIYLKVGIIICVLLIVAVVIMILRVDPPKSIQYQISSSPIEVKGKSIYLYSTVAIKDLGVVIKDDFPYPRLIQLGPPDLAVVDDNFIYKYSFDRDEVIISITIYFEKVMETELYLYIKDAKDNHVWQKVIYDNNFVVNVPIASEYMQKVDYQNLNFGPLNKGTMQVASSES